MTGGVERKCIFCAFFGDTCGFDKPWTKVLKKFNVQKIFQAFSGT